MSDSNPPDAPKSPKTPARPTIKAVRGTRDLLPDQTPLWNRVEATARSIFSRYGFGEIRTPIFEDTSLFSRSVGEETDIVSKEMFTWEDGERFDQSSLRDWWRRENQQRSTMLRKADDPFEIILHAKVGPNELVTFSRQLSPDLVSRIAAHPAPYFYPTDEIGTTVPAFYWAEDVGTYVSPEVPPQLTHLLSHRDPTRLVKAVKRLVVTSEIPNKADEWIDDGFVVEYAFGKFTKSSQFLTLRPESTAGTVRAYIEHKLGETGQIQKLYYIGPQFRRERPQRGRYRQFWQIGAEVIGPQSSGAESPLRDAELLEMLASFLNELGIRDWRLELNSIGSVDDRARYNAALREALAPIKHRLCPDNQRRAETNPLRVLDSKDEADQALINALPKIADYLGAESKAHFEQVLAALDACNIPYHLNPRLVRGLDYYTRTTFEFTVTTGLGTQNALLGGGRYDGLSEMLGGPKAPGIGFAIGEDRLILTLQAQAEADNTPLAAAKLDAYIAPLGAAQNPAALALARDLRSAGLSVEVGDGTFKLRKSFDIADTRARHIILLGEDEVATNILTVKTFATGEQTKVERAKLAVALA